MKRYCKKWLSLALALIFALGVIPFTAFAADTVASGACGSNLNWTLDSNGKLTVSGSGAMADYSMWGAPWNDYADDIKTLSVGSGVTSIGKNAFNDCGSLTTATLSANLTKIDDGAFCDCAKLASISIPNNVISIGEQAFQNCAALQNLTLPSGLRSIGAYAFDGSGITRITVPGNVSTVGAYAFRSCKGLTQATLSPGVGALGTYAFYGCTALTSVTIPDSITSLPAYAFYDCTSLNGVTLPAGLTSIGAGAFRGCSSLTGLTIPNGITTIEETTFYDCTGLTAITIPANVTSIGRSAFGSCTSLQELTIPDNVTSLGSQAFYCSGLTELHIGEGLTSIANSAFYSCSSLQTVSFPDSLTTIETQAFVNCTALDGVVFPNSVTTIDNSAFRGCTSLSEIVIPDSMTSISSYTFHGCTSLASITVPETVTEIGQQAFYNTKWFNDQPDGVVYVNKVAYAYKGSKSALTSVAFREGTISVSDSIFWSFSNLTSVTIPDTVTFIGPYAFGRCTRLTSVVIPDSCVTIGNNCFEGCSDSTKVLLPDSLQVIGANLFKNALGATAYVFENSAAHQYCIEKDITYQVVTVADEADSWSWSEDYDSAAVTLSVTPGNFTAVKTARGDDISCETQPPTHAENGLAVYTAAVTYGGKSFSDTREKTLYATGHEYDYANAVFNWDGYACETATATCPDDGATVDVDVTVSSETPVTPDCTNGGESVYTARFTVGEDTYTDTKTEILEATGHLHTETVPETASTCIAHGYTAGVYCNDCEQWVSGHEEKPLADHVWDDGEIVKEATCVSMGDRLYTCTVPGCGATDTRTDVAIDPDHHLNTAEEGETTSSCTAHGYTAGVWCGDCETWVSGHTEKALAPHSYVGPEWKWNGTASAKAVFACTRCGDTQSVPAAISSETVKEPTGTEAGKKVYTAAAEFEGETYTDAVEKTIPAQGDGLCKWCGERHEGFFGRILGFFHSVAYFFAHLFGRK